MSLKKKRKDRLAGLAVCSGSHKLKHRRKRMMSQNTSLSGVLQQISWPGKKRSQSYRNFKSGLVLIRWLRSQGEDEGEGWIGVGCGIPLGGLLSQSVIVTLVGVPLVACLAFCYSLTEDANRRMRPVRSYCSCILYSLEWAAHSTGVNDLCS